MKKTKLGFTLIELMIVVAIIGILAAIAIPNFLRYQLRSKFGELTTNVAAVVTSEEALKQGDRMLCPTAVTGVPWSIPILPAGTTVGTSKLAWAPGDQATSQAFDWIVQGSTYGQYNVAINGAPTVPVGRVATCTPPGAAAADNAGLAYSVAANSDIDGDTQIAAVCAWVPQFNTTGGIQTAAPACPSLGTNNQNCGGAWGPGTNPINAAIVCSSDKIF